MKKIGILSLLIFSFSVISFAQSSKVSSAINYLSTGELDRAKDAIDVAVINEKTMNESKTWFYRGKIYNAIATDQTGKYKNLAISPLDTALKSFKTALALPPDSKNFRKNMILDIDFLQAAYFNEAATAYGLKDFSAAYKNFTGSAEANNLLQDIDPTMGVDTGTIFNMAITADKIGKTDEAISTYMKLVDMGYSDPYVYQILAEKLVEMDKPDMAQQIIDKGRQKYPTNEAILITELNFYLSQGRAGEIVSKLESAITMDPTNSELYFALGNSYSELMKLDSTNQKKYFDGAVNAYKQAISNKPEGFDAYLNLGALYYNSAIELNKKMVNLPLDAEVEYKRMEKERNELYSLALPYFEQALKIDQTNIPIIQSLKEIYAKTNNFEKMNEMKKLLGEE